MKKLLYTVPFLLLLIGGYFLWPSSKPVVSNLNQARLMLSELRGGDFTHAGDREAVDMVITKIKQEASEVLNGNCLDVGCGFGGTADYLVKNGFKHVWGIDIDPAVIKYAKSKYKGIEFSAVDAASVSLKFDRDFFSFVYLFNVLYAIEDKVTVLRQLARVSKPGAFLMIFDYSVEETTEPLLDLTGKPMRPVSMKKIKQQLYESGWEVLEVRDLSETFVVWYEQLLQKLEDKKKEIKGHFLEKDIAKFSATYIHILHQLRHKILGGVLIYAKRI
ncbi:MAG: methyltransferase domain-containing protein [Alphaproteobacteria bacterium]